MLVQLQITNFAIIQQQNIVFDEGLTVLTGETGAGKSIILDAIRQLTGARTSTNYIRHGEKKAMIEGVFDYIESPELVTFFNNKGIQLDEFIVLRREILSSGKSLCRVNNIVVTLQELRVIASYLIDIHGQHDTQLLLKDDYQLHLIDTFSQHQDHLTSYQTLYDQWSNKKKALQSLKLDEQQILQKLDLLQFQYQELVNAKLIQDEEQQLIKEKAYLLNFEKISHSIQASQQLLQQGLIDQLYQLSENIQQLSQVAEPFSQQQAPILDAYYHCQDLEHQLANYLDQLEFDEVRLNDIETRLDLLNHLQRKYGKSNNELIAYVDALEHEIETLKNHEQTYDELIHEEQQLYQECLVIANRLSDLRQQSAKQLEEKIVQQLNYLEMPYVTIEFNFNKSINLTRLGIDQVEFLISTNKGEPRKHLSKIASGGELSRIMLAIKVIFAHQMQTTAVLFDEVDTGVSGRIAQKMGEKMYELAKGVQVLCISHLPQVAALANSHLLIVKSQDADRTYSTIQFLSGEARIAEIARMLAGNNITDLTMKNAKELLELAHKNF